MSDTKDNKLPAKALPETVTVVFSKEELQTLASLMSIAMGTFKDLADQALIEKRDNAFAVLSARQKLSALYVVKLSDALSIGEPESKTFH